MRTNFKTVGRRALNTIKRVGTVVRKGASTVRSILGTVDAATGGALTSMIQRDPRGAMALGALNAIADRDDSIADRDDRMTARQQDRERVKKLNN